jgi:hypothetical protein
LWAAPTTSNKDRKRLLRTLVGDVTLISKAASDEVRIGIHWRSGATDQLRVRRPAPATVTRRTASLAIDFVRHHRDQHDSALITALNAAGLKTGPGDRSMWRRYAGFVLRTGFLPPATLAPAELTVAQRAARLAITESAVYCWIARGHLKARRVPHGRVCVPFSADVEEACRRRVVTSAHIWRPMRRSSRTRPPERRRGRACGSAISSMSSPRSGSAPA